MSVKSALLLLTLLITVTQETAACGEDDKHMCNPDVLPMNCTNNPRIRVDKSSLTYQLILCADNANITMHFKCCDICEACGILTG